MTFETPPPDGGGIQRNHPKCSTRLNRIRRALATTGQFCALYGQDLLGSRGDESAEVW